MNRAILALTAVLLTLTGCSSTPDPTPTADYAGLVGERYETCLTDLGGGYDLSFASVDTTEGSRVFGIVTGIREAEILTWSVAESNTGDIITVPSDARTTDALASVGC